MIYKYVEGAIKRLGINYTFDKHSIILLYICLPLPIVFYKKYFDIYTFANCKSWYILIFSIYFRIRRFDKKLFFWTLFWRKAIK